MNPLLLSLVPILFAISACATSGSEPNRSESVQAMESSGDGLLAHDSQAESTQGIEEFEAPNVGETPPEMIPRAAKVESPVVCERVTPTGSRIPVRVCRSRAEIEEREKADQKMLREWQNKALIGVVW